MLSSITLLRVIIAARRSVSAASIMPPTTSSRQTVHGKVRRLARDDLSDQKFLNPPPVSASAFNPVQELGNAIDLIVMTAVGKLEEFGL
jgi:hypothetical protein